ncbi:MAG: carboxypeptidase regulatory-like domain-containing protein [Terriglobales bacterium]
MRIRFLYAIVVLLAASSAANLYAQDTASLMGTVRDASGAIVAGAQVTVSSVEHGIKRQTTSNTDGEYAESALPAPGTYDVTVTAKGFRKFEAAGVVLNVAQKSRVDVTLQVGTANTEVTVEATTAPQVQTESSELSGTVTGKEISQLQLNGRNFTQLVTLVPGVSNQTGQDEAEVGIMGSVAYSMNGGRIEYNNWELDGGDNMDNGSNGSLNVFPSIDAIAEFKVLTSNYGAQYGRNGSGTVETELKSGTSSFHGDLYEFVRNTDFNAKNYFNASTPPYHKNDFGGTIGGPVYIPGVYNKDKQKTFFFYSEEWRRESTPANYNSPVPYSAERSGDFTDVCPAPGSPVDTVDYPDCPVVPAYINGVAAPAPLVVGQYFPGQSVAPYLTAAGTDLLPLIPTATAGNDIPGAAFFITALSQPTTWREELFRIDHNINEHNRVSFHYVHDSWDQIEPSTLWTGSTFPTVQTNFNGPAVSMLARLTSTISPTLLNEFVASYTTDHLIMHSIGAWQSPQGGLPMGYLFPDSGYLNKLPMITITGGAAYGGGFYMDPDSEWPEGKYNSNPTYTYRDNMTKILGKHSLTFGAYFVAAQKNELSSLFPNGQLGYSTSSTVTTGNAFADMLLGNVGSFSQGSGQLKFYNRYKIVEPYIQDDWRATPRLTLNIGLRFSLFGTYREKYGHAYNWDPAVYSVADAPELDGDPTSINFGSLVPGVGNPYDGLVQCGTHGVPVGCSTGHLFNPAPRVGFAFDPWGDGKTAIRGGYGIFFEHTNGNEANTEALEGQSSPLLQTATQYNISGYANVGVGGGGALPPFSFISIPDKTTWPYMQQWHFDIQRQMPEHIVLTVSYVGSKGTHLTRQSDLNQVYPTAAAQNPYKVGEAIGPNDCGNGTTPSGVLIPGYNPNGVPGDQTPGTPGVNMFVACGGDADFFRPYLGISAVTGIQSASSSNYNGLEVSANRTLGGLTLDVAYTYSHSIDDSSDRYDSGFVNSYDFAANRASSSFDVRQQLNVAYVYDLPFFKSPGLSHTLLGSWQWSGIASYASGTPFSVFNESVYADNAGAGNGTLASGSYADKIGDPYTDIPPSPGGPQVAGFLYNPNAYTAPQGLTFGDSGRNSLHNPSRTNFDMALFKSFAVTESKRFEFRAEAFNVFNHTEWLPIYGDAGSGANANSSYSNGYGANTLFQFLGAHNPRILQLGAKFIF